MSNVHFDGSHTCPSFSSANNTSQGVTIGLKKSFRQPYLTNTSAHLRIDHPALCTSDEHETFDLCEIRQFGRIQPADAEGVHLLSRATEGGTKMSEEVAG